MTPRISNIEFGFIIGTLALIDLAQIAIEWIGLALTAVFGIGIPILLFANRFIDIGVGLILPLYLRLRGQKVTSPSQLGGLIGTFILEFIPGLGELPLWSLDGGFYMYTIKQGYKKEDALIAQETENQRLKEQSAINNYQEATQTEQQEEMIDQELQATQAREDEVAIEENRVGEQAEVEEEQMRNVVDLSQYRNSQNIADTSPGAEKSRTVASVTNINQYRRIGNSNDSTIAEPEDNAQSEELAA